MAVLPTSFDTNQHEDMQGSFDVFPAGDYLMQITGSDIKDTKKKDGKYIKLEFTLLDGEYKGRKIWTNLNIINPNPVAVEIANKELATIGRAVGVVAIQDTQQLHGIPMVVKAKIQAAKGDFPAQNVPCGYEAAAGVVAGSANPANTGAPSGSGVPWAGKEPTE